MAYRSLAHFVQRLEENGKLVRIREFVSPGLEITEVADRMVKNGGRALLFENNGTRFPLLINAFASDRRICLALGVNQLNEIGHAIERLARDILGPKAGLMDKLRVLPTLKDVASWLPSTLNRKGACQEVVMDRPDLGLLPVMKCWPADGGPFITLPGVHTVDPDTGVRNLGMYRMQVFSGDTTGMHWHRHKGSAAHFLRYKALGKRMPVTVTLGGDPAYIYAATAPLPENLDEYILAGFLRRKKVAFVRCLTNELLVPEDVDFVIEGYVDPGEEPVLEGPFGDHTGFYSLADYFPRFHVTCITHRRNAIYPSTIVGIPPQEDAWIGKATEHIFTMPLRMSAAPEMTSMHMPPEGVFHNICLAGIRKEYPGQAPKVMSALWGAGQMMFNKIMVVTGPDTDLGDYRSVARAVSEHADPVSDIHFLRGPVDILDHASSRYAYGSKIGIDATAKLPEEMTPPLHPSPSRGGAGGEVLSDQILNMFPEITVVRTDLPKKGISLLIISFRKTKKNHARLIAAELLGREMVRDVKFILFLDEMPGLEDLSMITWIAANNLDPVRDCFYIEREPGIPWPCLIADATRKTRELDGFERDWPNVIVMDDRTIASVDEKWNRLGIGQLIVSPSVKYKKLVTGDGAIRGNDR